MIKQGMGRRVASGALAVALGAFMCAPAVGAVQAGVSLGDAPAALAAVTYGTGDITIAKNAKNGTLTYDGYQIFKANVTDGTGGKVAKNVAWASDAVKAAVEGAITAADSSYQVKTAQDAAEFIKAHITGTDNSTRVSSDSFASALAAALDQAESSVEVAPGTATSLGEGYWLFVTDKASAGKKDTTGTAPIFAIVGGNAVNVTEKTSVPTVDKQVADDQNEQPGAAADSFIGQELTYTLTGTVADNIASYETYQYKFTDTLSEGLDYVDGTVKVTVGGTDVTGQFDIGYENHVLTVSIANLKDIAGVDANTSVVVTYKAKLNAKAATDISGSNNKVELTYSNNPRHEGTGTATDKTTKTFTYQLQLHKVDRTTETNLAGAKFTLQYEGEGAANGQYVTADGSAGTYTVTGTGTEATEFETGSDGMLNVTGLNAGKYKVHETTAPVSYDAAADFEITINPTYAADGQSRTALGLELNATDAESVIAGKTDADTSDNILKSPEQGVTDAADNAKGSVLVTVGDVKQIAGLPLTGMGGVALTFVAGGAILILAIGYGVRASRRRREEL